MLSSKILKVVIFLLLIGFILSPVEMAFSSPEDANASGGYGTSEYGAPRLPPNEIPTSQSPSRVGPLSFSSDNGRIQTADRIDQRLLFDTSDVTILLPPPQHKIKVSELFTSKNNPLWFLTEANSLTGETVASWLVVGIRLVPCHTIPASPAITPCAFSVVVTAQPKVELPISSQVGHKNSAINLIFDFDAHQDRELYRFVLDLQALKYDFEKNTFRTTDGLALDASTLFNSSRAPQYLTFVKEMLIRATRGAAPDYLVLNYTPPPPPPTAVAASEDGTETAPSPVTKPVPQSTALQTRLLEVSEAGTVETIPNNQTKQVPHHVSALREGNRQCQGNRVAQQLNLLTNDKSTTGYSSFSRRLPSICENQRLFGYYRGVPVISAEVALLSAQVAQQINYSYISSSQSHGPGMNCNNQRRQAAMCHMLRGAPQRCLSICSRLETRKTVLVPDYDLQAQMQNAVPAPFPPPPPNMKPPLNLAPQLPNSANATPTANAQPSPPPPVRYRKVLASDLAHLPSNLFPSNYRHLNVACLSSDKRLAQEQQSLVIVASIPLRGESSNVMNIRLLAPSRTRGEHDEFTPIHTTGNTGTDENIVNALNSTNGIKFNLEKNEDSEASVFNLKCITRVEQRMTTKNVSREIRVTPQAPASPRRQTEVYNAGEARGGLHGEDALLAAARRAASQAPPPPPRREIVHSTIQVPVDVNVCTKQYAGELRLRLLDSENPSAGSIELARDMNCEVFESNYEL